MVFKILAFGGGGSRGILHTGAIKYFEESGLLANVTDVYGCSIGSVYATAIALGLNSEQIKEMMLLFNFEANRLEVAKAAHNRCVDKNNYFLLNDAFQFESSVEELNESIK